MAPNRKFTPEQEQTIRAEALAGKSQRVLAAQYQTTQSLISKIIAEGNAVVPDVTRPDANLLMLEISAIEVSDGNPRKTFDQTEIEALGESIAASGLLQNLVVAKPVDDGRYIIAAGERRLRALRWLAGNGRWEARIPCRVISGSAEDRIVLALLENIQRVDMPPLEEGDAFVKLIEHDAEAFTTASIAARIGRTQRYVQQRIALATKLAPLARDALTAHRITIEGARILAAHDIQTQTDVLEDFGGDDRTEISVDELMSYLPMPPGAKAAPLEALAPDDAAPEPSPQASPDAADVFPKCRVCGKTKAEDFAGLTYWSMGYECSDCSAADDGARKAEPAVEADTEPTAGPLWTRGHIYHAHKRKAAAMQFALLGSLSYAMRLICVALLGPQEAIYIGEIKGWNQCIEDEQPSLPAIDSIVKRIMGKIKPPETAGDTKAQLATWKHLCGVSHADIETLFTVLVADKLRNPAGYKCTLGDDPLALAIAQSLKIPFCEEEHGLLMRRDDLTGLRKSLLLKIADDSNTPAVNDATPIGELIDAIATKSRDQKYVVPTLRFGTTADIQKGASL